MLTEATLTHERPSERYFNKHVFEVKTTGRHKGAKNRTTTSVKLSLLEAYRLAGGIDGLVKWAKEKPDLFYPMLAKLLPMELAESGHNQPIRVLVYAPQADSQASVRLEETQAVIPTSGPNIK